MKKCVVKIKELGFEIPLMPEGAFYLYVDVSKFGVSGEDFCQRLLTDFHIAVTPGTDFGFNESHKYVRFSYATSEANIEEGLSRLAKFMPTIC